MTEHQGQVRHWLERFSAVLDHPWVEDLSHTISGVSRPSRPATPRPSPPGGDALRKAAVVVPGLHRRQVASYPRFLDGPRNPTHHHSRGRRPGGQGEARTRRQGSTGKLRPIRPHSGLYSWPLLQCWIVLREDLPAVNGARGRSYLMVSRHVCCRRSDCQVPRAGR